MRQFSFLAAEQLQQSLSFQLIHMYSAITDVKNQVLYIVFRGEITKAEITHPKRYN